MLFEELWDRLTTWIWCILKGATNDRITKLPINIELNNVLNSIQYRFKINPLLKTCSYDGNDEISPIKCRSKECIKSMSY